MEKRAVGMNVGSDHARYLQLLDTVHLLRTIPAAVELEFLLPDDLFAGCQILYGLPVRRARGVTPGVVARLPASGGPLPL